MHRILKEFW